MAPPRSPIAEPPILYPLPMTVQQLPTELRPREEVRRRGIVSAPDDVLLAILLRSGVRGMNVIELAREILRRCGGLNALSAATIEEIRALGLKGLGEVKAMEMAAAFELGRRAAQLGPRAEAPVVREPADVWRLLDAPTRPLRQEFFWVLPLNTKHRLIGQPQDLMRGQLDASLVHPREIFSLALRYSAAAVIVAHNHPSGDPTPSAEDLRVTRQLVDAARMIGVQLLDHIIIGRPAEGRAAFLSLREQGLVAFDA